MSQKKTSLIALILLSALIAVMSFVSPMNANATDARSYLNLPVDIPTFLYAFAAPNPVGVGQNVWIYAIFTKPLPTSNGFLGDMHENITIEIVAPNGQKTVLGPFDGGMVGSCSATFTPNQVGNYTIIAKYPGQTLTLTNPYNRDPTTADRHLELKGSHMLPSEDQFTLTVQEEPVDMNYKTPALPTEYWKRPIFSLNWDWGKYLGSNWLGLDATGFSCTGKYDASGCYQPYGTAPNTAHIMWSKSTRFGGQPGGPIISDQASQFSSTSVVINMYDGAIVINGIAYYTLLASWTGTPVSWEAVDLRTGETIWSKPAGVTGEERLQMGQILRFHNAQEYGSIAYLYTLPDAKGVMRIYDAATGILQANVTNSMDIAFICDDNPNQDQIGSLLGYYVVGGNLTCWNSTKIIEYTTRLQVRTKLNVANYTWSQGISWSVPLPTKIGDNTINLGVAAVTPEVILLRDSPTIDWQPTSYGWQVTAGYDAKTGVKLWGPINQTLPLFEGAAVLAARDGKYILYNKDKNTIDCYSLTDGQKLWGPTQLQYNAWSSQYAGADIAYGKVYLWDTGGNVNAVNLETGKLLWNWSRGSAGYDTPYGVYEIFGYRTHAIADGKLFLQEGYMYSPPLHPAKRIVLDCETGELVWSILSYSARAGSVIADGFLLEWDSYDCQLYCFGKGPSETSVSIKNNVIMQGSGVLIEGTVMDISAGAKQNGVVERFPKGLPAVSDESMSTWMEYVYKQQSKPTNVKGVEVIIEVLDPNNNYYEVARTTSDASGFFKATFEP
ncbi:MAG: PQQ-binding-like beta-propeller repeat protein, partial [Candidatus Bathyarchaeia archaeon]